LSGNTHVNKITARFASGTEEVNIDLLLQVIENRKQLEELYWSLSDHLPGCKDCLLQAVSRNDSIHTLSLLDMLLSADIMLSLVRSTTSLLKLDLGNCRIHSLHNGPDLLASAFRANSSIMDLSLWQMQMDQ
jgi:hypothetical protein